VGSKGVSDFIVDYEDIPVKKLYAIKYSKYDLVRSKLFA
jgi:hypothetical protein